MSMPATPDPLAAVTVLLSELIDGAHAGEPYVLNPGDAGLLQSLNALSAQDASQPTPGGGASIAAHVDHVRYGLELLNRWSKGEEPFADAKYAASWSRGAVSEDEWRARLIDLERQARAWQSAVRAPTNPTALTLVLSSVVHLAYHLGAMRQINRALRGPQARD
jgi:hypothetical protein